VADQSEGQIVTDWKPIRGKNAGLLWWKKEYQSEVRHTITIKQALYSPGRASYSILTEVRERPNPSYGWAAADSELGRKSFEDIKNLLLTSIRAELVNRSSKR
jgi:hypothetical protein